MKSSTLRAANVLLWLAQGLIAIALISGGALKIINPASLPFPWIAENHTLAFITGVVDIMAGLGVLLPTWLRILPRLTAVAALGVVALMVAAIAFHVARGESGDIGFNLFMLVLASFIAWGRRNG